MQIARQIMTADAKCALRVGWTMCDMDGLNYILMSESLVTDNLSTHALPHNAHTPFLAPRRLISTHRSTCTVHTLARTLARSHAHALTFAQALARVLARSLALRTLARIHPWPARSARSLAHSLARSPAHLSHTLPYTNTFAPSSMDNV